MTLLTPLALLGALIAVPIVLMYVLKLRRQEQLVSSTFLWQRVVEDVQANVPWQRLRPNILLFLQLLALAVLVLALARPAFTQARAYEGDLVLIVDQSYGMQVTDVRPSRFAEALMRAHKLASQLSSGNVVSVVGMGAQPRLAIAESDDQGAISRAIDSLHAGMSRPNFLAALSLAASLARNGARTHVVVLTSRDSGISGLPLSVSFPVDVDRIGGRVRDLGLTAFWAAPAEQNTQVVLRVHNFGSSAESSDLELYVDGQLADVRPVSLAAGQESTQVWTHLPAGIDRLEARLTRVDDMRADKVAWAAVPQNSARRILLVTKGDYFLNTALDVNPSVQLAMVKPGDYDPTLAEGADLVVFDGWLPDALPMQSTLLVAPTRGKVAISEIASNREAPLVFGSERTLGGGSIGTSGAGSLATLLQYVDFGDVHIAQARDLTAPAWLQPVVVSGGRTLLAAGDRGNTRVAVLTFNLQESDWPLRISFPITIQNILHFLAPGLALGTVDLAAGQPLRLFPEAGTREIQIIHPNGTVDHLHPPFAPFTDTSQPGLYVARGIGGGSHATVPFAVNFFPTRSRPAAGPEVLHLGQELGGGGQHLSVPVSFAWAFGLLALAVLTVEWWVGFRR